MTEAASSPESGAGDHTNAVPGRPETDTTDDPAAAAKRELRDRVLAARRHLSALDREAAATATLRHLLDLPEVRLARRVGAYVSVGSEPATPLLLAALREHGTEVLLPVLLPDNDLDWAAWTGPESLAAAGRGLWEPTGPRLGPMAVADVDVVVVPGVAVDPNGHRLGRGGGSYDRALARVSPNCLRVLLLHTGEFDLPVPVEEHDEPVDVAVGPDGVVRYR